MTQSPLQRYWPLFSVTAILAILVAAGVFVVATLPPRTIVMATGPEGGGNYQLGDRYREFLAKSGVELKLMPTAGSLENLKLLRDSKSGVSVALVQGGAASGVETSSVESLGTIAYEPLWLFHRSEIEGNLRGLAGRRVSIGSEGSGARAFALDVLKRTKTEGTIRELLGYSPQVAAEKLIAGDIDAAFIVTGWDSPAIQSLINAKGVELASFPRADAMVALYPFLTKLSLPRGIFDISADRPAADVVLLGAKTILAVRANLHPALQYLLLAAATEIHSESGIFQKAEQFPIAESVDLPLSAEAERFHKSGRPFLQEQLPFWFAVLIGRVLFVLVPVVAVAYPIIKFLPMMYNWFMSSRIQRFYGEMRLVENTMEDHARALDVSAMTAKINKLEQRAIHLRLPSAYDSSLYTMRVHMGLLRSHLQSILENQNTQREESQSRSDLSQASRPDRKSTD
jgi:TRAP transporter TAXI family solute receptor